MADGTRTPWTAEYIEANAPALRQALVEHGVMPAAFARADPATRSRWTANDIEAQAGTLQQLLAARGVTPPETGGTESAASFHEILARAGIDPNLTLDQVFDQPTREALMLEQGRERARPRFEPALERAKKYGYEELHQRIENMIETEAQRHARRGQRRGGGIGSDAVAAPPASSPGRSTVAPPLPVAGMPPPSAESLMQGIQRLGAPQTARQAQPMPPTLTGIENQPSPARNPTEQAIEGTSYGIDYGRPRTGISLPETAANLLQAYDPYYRPGRPSEGMVARPLRPQSIQEEYDQRGNNAALAQAFETGGQAGLALLAPEARAIQGAATAGRAIAASPPGQWVGRNVVEPVGRFIGAVGRNPITAPTAVGGTTFAATAQTQTPSQDRSAEATAQRTLDRLLERQKNLEEQQAVIQADIDRFGKLNWKDADAVRGVQEEMARANIRVRNKQGDLVPAPVDGREGELTRAAVAAYRARRERDLQGTVSQLSTMTGDNGAIAIAQADVRAGRDADATAAGSRRMQEVGQPTFLEQWGNIGGLTAGAIAGGVENYLAGRLVRGIETSRLARSNRLLGDMGSGSPTERASRVNQFWTEGGARPSTAPFTYTPNASPYPFTATNRALDASRLYQPRSLETFGPAAIISTKGGLESTIAYSQLEGAHQEMARAQQALREKPNDEARIQDVLSARNKVASLEAAIRFGIGESLGAVSEAGIARVTHRPPRPDVYRAERERGDVDLLLRPQPPPPPLPPPPLPPQGPFQPGITRFRDLRTGEERFLDRAGNWQGPLSNGRHGYSGPPPATWQRISQFGGGDTLGS